MNLNVRKVLIQTARQKKVIYYQELCNRCHLTLEMRENPYDRKIIGDILGEISEFEHENNRPLLSSLVLTRSGEEGDGFYKLCEALGITNDWKRFKKEGTFPVAEIQRCHEFWTNDLNYEKYNQV